MSNSFLPYSQVYILGHTVHANNGRLPVDGLTKLYLYKNLILHLPVVYK
jgi:hypothetical protein